MNWQPIETAPRDGTTIDLWVKGGYRVTNCRWAYHHWLNGEPQGEKTWTTHSQFGPPTNATHWMPVPEPPK